MDGTNSLPSMHALPIELTQLSHELKHSLTHSHSHSHTHTHTLTLTHSHTHTHTHSLTLTHSHSHTHTLTLIHSHTHTLTHSHTHIHVPAPPPRGQPVLRSSLSPCTAPDLSSLASLQAHKVPCSGSPRTPSQS